MEEVLAYIGIFLLACLKSIFPPVLGPQVGMTNLEIILITLAGLMTSVTLFTFLGEKIKKHVIPVFIKNPKKFSPKSRRMVRIWKKYGIVGVCFLTPLILSPPGGALLVSSVGAPRKQVFFYMLLFGIMWSTIWTYSVDWLMDVGLVSSH
ncbi:hypothetical protein [Roseivirga misakiensis]|uniref:Small multi-drug export protein n=1 Tax=Roseivirga misakiensis TaxID=1563681 RepID=A0A1E5T5H0_9BACT|nr:hypothetical protein [Roseivirga misakiensis]OEK06610.1 hypothetical protein BFP71_02780 [Roseivirga misakiensis]